MKAVLTKDRLAPLAALAGVTLLAWIYLGLLSSRVMPLDSDGMGMAMAPVGWSAGDAAWMFLMWAVMMIGMMLPSAAPIVLLYDQLGKKARADGHGFAGAGWFAGGYLLAWTGFAAIATLAQFLLEQAALVSREGRAISLVLASIPCLAFALYQFTPLKQACLSQCRAPLAFIQRHGGFRATPGGALGLGLRHGLYCIGCCWAVMALLFVFGVMNLVWVGALAVFVLAEKLLPGGVWIGRLSGLAALVAGLILLLA